ncbi:prolactin-inducible protein [Nannospalax galili]|uniref:Prolactin-induced protein n=1 Tax=Nannospalax galili TaxID=1026970 RepID=A0A8C6RW11_NANGA|nr:prolactin-inducible protein [Nannospalax galili]
MTSLRVLYQPCTVVLLLVLCLILETGQGQENRDNLLSLNMSVSQLQRENEFSVTFTVTNNMDKCMVVEISTEDNPNITYLTAHAKYTACICDTHNYFWDIDASANTVIRGKAEVVSAKNICPDGEILYPETGFMKFATADIIVTP